MKGDRWSFRFPAQHQPLLRPVPVYVQTEPPKDVSVQQLPILALETIRFREQSCRAGELLLHQQPERLAEVTHGKRVFAGKRLERTRPTVGQRQNTLRRNVERSGRAGAAPWGNPLRHVNLLTVHFDGAALGTLPPHAAHPFPQINVEEGRNLALPFDAVLVQLVMDVASVQGQLEKLQKDALAGRLRADQHREVAKFHFRTVDLANPNQLQPVQRAHSQASLRTGSGASICHRPPLETQNSSHVSERSLANRQSSARGRPPLVCISLRNRSPRSFEAAGTVSIPFGTSKARAHTAGSSCAVV